MALPRPEPGLHCIQTVRVNGLHHYPDYLKLAGYLKLDAAVHLIPDFKNPHDSNAVKVCLEGRQLGWVPQNCNRDIAARLRRSEELVARVSYHDYEERDLQIDVYAGGEISELRWQIAIALLGVPSNQAGRIARLKSYPNGTGFKLRSDNFRTSISIVSPEDGKDLAWLLKAQVPADIVQGMCSGRLVAVKIDDYIRFDNLGAQGSSQPEASPTGRLTESKPELQNIPPTQKENTMNFSNIITKTIETNKSAAAQAGYLEAGRIANNQLTKLASKSLPMMARGYADTPLGRLLTANLATVAAAQLRPNDPTLAKLTQAMTVAAYQEVIQGIDIEGMINGLMESPEIQTAISKLPKEEGVKA